MWVTKKDKRIVLIKNDECLKAAATRNKCLKKCTGKYVAIQDADDISVYNRIELQVNELETHPDFDFVSSAAFIFTTNEKWKK